MNLLRNARSVRFVSARRVAPFLVCICLLPAAAAQTAPAAAAPRADTQPREKFPEPLVRDHVTQDRAVRIQERQVRGATTSIQVQPLHGGAAYDVVPPSVSSNTDPANLQGRAQWKVLTFR
jgi:hypothetical protein